MPCGCISNVHYVLMSDIVFIVIIVIIINCDLTYCDKINFRSFQCYTHCHTLADPGVAVGGTRDRWALLGYVQEGAMGLGPPRNFFPLRIQSNPIYL